MEKIKFFSHPECPYCQALKDFFLVHKIDFEEFDVREKKIKEYLYQKFGKVLVPYLEIKGQKILGFQKEKIKKILNL